MLLPEPAEGAISGGGCLSIGTDGDVGETCALFSLPGPTFPGSMLWPLPGAFGGISLAEGSLTLGELACPGCRTQYDVRAAGRSLGDPAVHLDPLPLLSDSQGVRVAVTAPQEAISS